VGVGGSGVGEGVSVAVARFSIVGELTTIIGVFEGGITAGPEPCGLGRLHAKTVKIRINMKEKMELFFFMGALLAVIIIPFVIQINRDSGVRWQYPSLARRTKFRHNSIHSENCEEK
jgi:hypothetical protein